MEKQVVSLILSAKPQWSFNADSYYWREWSFWEVTSFSSQISRASRVFTSFCEPLWASSSPESNETRPHHHVKAINPAPVSPVFVSDTGADSAHGQLHEPLEPQPPAGLAPAARPLGRRRAALPRDELHHQGPHTTVKGQQRLFDYREAWWQQLPLVWSALGCMYYRTGTRRLFFQVFFFGFFLKKI